jgi:type II secretory pathway pseudopilin PulG
MQLRGQDNPGQRGYAMATLLVAMSVMAIMMTVAMPAWKQAATREKEAELVFRGEQYVHAIGLFKRKFANASPPNVDVLVEQRFLRKKYKDPITKDDFQLITENQPVAAGGSQTAAGSQQGRGTAPTPAPATGGGLTSTTPGSGTIGGGGATSSIGSPLTGATGGVIGVTSKSKDKSVRLYKGRNHYNEWAFIYTQQAQTPGAGAPGAGAPGATAPGQRGGQQGPGGSPLFPGATGPGRGTPQRGLRGMTIGPDGRVQPIDPNQAPPGGRGRGPGR